MQLASGNPSLSDFREEPVDLNDLSQETVELLVPDAAARGARVQTNLHGTPLVVWGDRAHLQQVLLNLLLNGLDALAHTAPEHRYLVVSTAIHNSQAEVSVQDRGSGIPVGAMQHMFEPFFSTKTEGMGMGLSIARLYRPGSQRSDCRGEQCGPRCDISRVSAPSTPESHDVSTLGRPPHPSVCSGLRHVRLWIRDAADTCWRTQPVPIGPISGCRTTRILERRPTEERPYRFRWTCDQGRRA